MRMNVDRDLMKQVLGVLQKRAYAPPTEPVPLDPTMGIAGQMTPESNQMLGAMPPGAMPQDMGAMPPGAMPPGAMPPGAMPPGAMPPGAMPQDMGAMPQDMVAMPQDIGTNMPIQLSMADLQSLSAQAQGSGEGESSGRVTNRELLETLSGRLDRLEQMLETLVSGLGGSSAPAVPSAEMIGPESVAYPVGGNMGMTEAPSLPVEEGIPGAGAVPITEQKAASDSDKQLMIMLRRLRTLQ